MSFRPSQRLWFIASLLWCHTALATVPEGAMERILDEFRAAKSPLFYAACDFGSNERVIWLFSSALQYGVFIAHSKSDGRNVPFRSYELSPDGKVLGGDYNFGTWAYEKYRPDPNGPSLLKDFPDREFRMVLPGHDFMKTIIANSAVTPCEVQPKPE